MNRNLRIPTLLLAAALLLALSACGSASERSRGTPASASDLAAIEERADQIYTQIWGTADKKEAAHYLEFVSLNAATVECMKGAGFDFKPRFTPLWLAWEPNATESNGWLGELDRAPSERAAARAAADIPPATSSSSSLKGYEDALSACDDSAGGVVDFSGSPSVEALSLRYHALLDRVGEQLGSIDEYHDCMRGRGFPVGADGESGAAGLQSFLEARMPHGDPDPSSPTAAWSRYLTLENSALEADRQCRTAKYQLGLQILDGLLTDFEAAHEAELRESDAIWSRTHRRALSAGLPEWAIS